LYFGAHWLTDVVGSLTLGLAWVAALGLAYRRHVRRGTRWCGLQTVALGTFILAFGVQSALSHDSDLDHFRPKRQILSITEVDWKTQLWSALAQTRNDAQRGHSPPLNLQYAGKLADLRSALAPAGWKPGARLDWGTALKLLSPSLPLRELPIVPHVHDGRHESLALVKNTSDDSRLVLRLWPTPYRIEGTTPLWIGNVTSQQKRTILDLLAIPATDRDALHPLQSVRTDFSGLHPVRPGEGTTLLIRADGNRGNR
jgi:hypothetical protein